MSEQEVKLTGAEWLEAQRLANETEQKRIDAARGLERDQARLIAMNCALASFGRGHSQLNPSSAPIQTHDLISRAAAILGFFEGRTSTDNVLELVAPPSPPDAA